MQDTIYELDTVIAALDEFVCNVGTYPDEIEIHPSTFEYKLGVIKEKLKNTERAFRKYNGEK